MKILRTISSFYPCLTGPINQAFKISSELENIGISSPILTTCFRAKSSPAREEFDNVYVIRYRSQIQIMKYCISLGLIKGLLQECDIIHSHEYRAFQSDLGWLISNIKKNPFVISTHGNLLCYKYILKGVLPKFPYILHDLFTLRSVVKRANVVIVSSKVEYEDAIRFGIEKKQIELIPPGIDTFFYGSDTKLRVPSNDLVKDAEDKLKLLFVGRLSRDRNLETTLYAIRDLPDVIFYIVGDELSTSGFSQGSYLKELKSLVSKLEISQKVKFVGQQYRKDLISWYKTADIFINTSRYESFGQAILEAAASGLPIISTPVGIANEIIKDSCTGFIVSENPSFIAQRIKELFSKALREEFGFNLKEMVRKNYDWHAIMNKYIKLYEALA